MHIAATKYWQLSYQTTTTNNNIIIIIIFLMVTCIKQTLNSTTELIIKHPKQAPPKKATNQKGKTRRPEKEKNR